MRGSALVAAASLAIASVSLSGPNNTTAGGTRGAIRGADVASASLAVHGQCRADHEVQVPRSGPRQHRLVFAGDPGRLRLVAERLLSRQLELERELFQRLDRDGLLRRLQGRDRQGRRLRRRHPDVLLPAEEPDDQLQHDRALRCAVVAMAVGQVLAYGLERLLRHRQVAGTRRRCERRDDRPAQREPTRATSISARTTRSWRSGR